MSSKTVKKGIIGKKLGMTQIFREDGTVVPVTVIQAGPCVVVQKKSVETDGYNAIQLSYGDIAERKVNKPRKGHFKKAGVTMKKYLKEFKFADYDSFKVGDVVGVDSFAEGESVDVTGITKGHGYSGGVKRWGMATLRMSHGTGPVHRHVGSLGANSDPSRIMKNKKMPGQYGNDKLTVLNLKVIKVDAEKNLIAVRGAVPGARGGIVFLRNAVKA